MSAASPELLGRLLDEHGAALVLYAQQWCETPEDVVQEAFLALVRQAALPENLVAWLYRVVRNEALSASRSSGRRARREAAAAHAGEPWFEPREGERLDAAAATRALERLPIDQREIIGQVELKHRDESIGELPGGKFRAQGCVGDGEINYSAVCAGGKNAYRCGCAAVQPRRAYEFLRTEGRRYRHRRGAARRKQQHYN